MKTLENKLIYFSDKRSEVKCLCFENTKLKYCTDLSIQAH